MSLHLKLLCGILIAVALSVFAYRWLVLGYPLTPDASGEVWQLETQVAVEGEGGPARVSIFIPPPDGRYGAVEESYAGGDLSLTVQRTAEGNYSAVWSTADLGGRAGVRFRGLYFLRPERERSDAAARSPRDLPPSRRYPPSRSGEAAMSADALLDTVAAGAAGPETLAALLLRRLADARGGGESYGLVDPDMSDATIAELAAYVLSRGEVSARAVRGFSLAESRRSATGIAWLEVWNGRRWMSFDVASGDLIDATPYLVWRRGEGPPIEVEGARIVSRSIALVEQRIGGMEALRTRAGLDTDGPLVQFTLLNLPVGTQMVIRLLLIIPLGGLLLVFLRQIVGVATIGTFMPVLIALAFEMTGAAYGVLFFTMLVGIGLLARFYFAQFNLLLVPRLAAMMIVVIFLMILVVILADGLGVGLGAAVSLFPIVVLTMTIERLSVVWEEAGAGEALAQGIGSLGVAVVVHLFLQWDPLIHLLFTFPELMLVLLAVVLMLGRYSGYRLTEAWRFRDLIAEERRARA